MISFGIEIWAGAYRASAVVFSWGDFTVAAVVIVCLRGSNTGCRKVFNVGPHNQTNNESDDTHYEFEGGASHDQNAPSLLHLLEGSGEGIKGLKKRGLGDCCVI